MTHLADTRQNFCWRKFLLLGCSFLMFPDLLWAAEKKTSSAPVLHIQQEKFRSRGVLVSRPRAVQQNVANFLQTHRINSLEDYARWLEQHIRYEADFRPDQWARPEDFLYQRRGDCEDFASLTTTVMRLFGHQPHFLALTRPGRSHAICTFRQGDHYIWFDNATMKKTKANSLHAFARSIAKEYNYSSLLELNAQTRHWVVLYQDQKS